MSQSNKPGSPFLAWFEAGAGLVSEQINQVTEMVNKRIDESHALFEELQHRGEEIDGKLRDTLNPSQMFSSLQELVMANPFMNWVPGFPGKQSKREQQINALSAKVDLLVEQVALLAAKQAAAKKQAATKAQAKAKPVAAKTPRKRATTATKAAAAKTTTTKTTTRKTTTRKAPAKPKATGTDTSGE